jgi:hypothetical protein
MTADRFRKAAPAMLTANSVAIERDEGAPSTVNISSSMKKSE